MSDRILYQWQDGSYVELLLGEIGSEEAIFLYMKSTMLAYPLVKRRLVRWLEGQART